MQIDMVYASTSGNVETVVEYVAGILDKAGFTTVLHRAEETDVEIFDKNHFFILATSTWEHGKLNPFFVPLLKDMKAADLRGNQAAFIGLGDRRYEPVLFTEGMNQVKEVWLKQGGEEVGEPLRIQGEPYTQLEMLVKPWAEKLATMWKQT